MKQPSQRQPVALGAEVAARIREIWESTRSQAARTVNSAHVCANWLIGREIVEAEQGGADRAEYGARLLKDLSGRLSEELGSGFAISSLKYMRSFYLAYPDLLPMGHAARGQSESGGIPGSSDRIGHALRGQFPEGEAENGVEAAIRKAAQLGVSGSLSNWTPGRVHPGLSWTHYRALLKVSNRAARDFYEIEAIRNGWSARQLDRQICSLLFERLLKSRDRDGLLALASDGQVVDSPIDAIKDPYVLEFLDLPESPRLAESDLESALIAQLQAFLLELGSGFAFIGRQVRLTLDGDHFYPDLVFYHAKLKCYVILDLKVAPLSHADLGQMQLYVNYYDREVAEPSDNPTIGLILCTDKNEAVVRYVLDEKKKQIFASRYQLHLPTEEQLRSEIRRELERAEIELAPEPDES